MSHCPLEAAGPIVAKAVVAEAARTGRQGVVLASPPGPVAELLGRWLAPHIRVRGPDAGAVADVAGALAAAGAPGPLVEALAWSCVAEAFGAAERLLPVGCTNKTELLLDPGPLPARVLPLGDLWASLLWAHLGRVPLPPVLEHADWDEVAVVERALAAYLERGLAPEDALGSLGSFAEPVRSALDAAEARRRGIVVPKLTS